MPETSQVLIISCAKRLRVSILNGTVLMVILKRRKKSPTANGILQFLNNRNMSLKRQMSMQQLLVK